jgi:hypothetical protein
MGTWDVGSFDNDTAADWAYGLDEVHDLSYVETTLDRVASHPSEQDLSAEAGECAIAAAEVIARLLQKGGEESAYSESVDTWVRAHRIAPPPALVTKALAALDRVMAPPSELRELWEETNELDGWLDAVAELKGRLA